jgi:hypothetical protein
MRTVAQRDPVTGRYLTGNNGAQVGRLTRAKRERMKLEELENSLENGEMPLDFMLRIMRDRREPGSTRFLAAKAAAPYCHAQLQAVAHKHLNADGTPIAPVVKITVMEPPEQRPQLTSTGPKSDDTVQ